jgi:hypothetical protein
MPVLIFLLVAAAVGGGFFALRARRPSSIESGISSFRREMNALAPLDQRRVETEPGVGPLHRDPDLEHDVDSPGAP